MKLTGVFSFCCSPSERKRSGNCLRNSAVTSNPAAAKALPNALRSPPPAGLTWQTEHLSRSSGRENVLAAKIFRYSGRACTVLTVTGPISTTAEISISNLTKQTLYWGVIRTPNSVPARVVCKNRTFVSDKTFEFHIQLLHFHSQERDPRPARHHRRDASQYAVDKMLPHLSTPCAIPRRRSYSVTTRVPDISSWPLPQNTSQVKLNLPVLPGLKLTRLTVPGFTSVRTPKSDRLKPCARSSEVSSRTTGSPFLTVILPGVNSKFFAFNRITFSGAGATFRARVSVALPSAAARAIKRMIVRFICLSFSDG